MFKTLFATVVAAFFVSETALANKIIDLNTSKSKVLFEALKSGGAAQVGTNINVSGVYCFVRYERQSGDPGQKAQILAMSNCNFDGDNNLAPFEGRKADKVIAALAQSGVRLGKAYKQEGGIAERSLFVQSISCSKYLEVGQSKNLKEITVAVHICSVEI